MYIKFYEHSIQFGVSAYSDDILLIINILYLKQNSIILKNSIIQQNLHELV